MTPDIEVSSEKVLELSYVMALRKVLEELDKPSDVVEKALKKGLQETLAKLEK